MKEFILRMLGGGGSLVSFLVIGIAKEIIRRISKPEKIVGLAADLLKEAAVKDPKTDWKDFLSNLIEERKSKD